MLRSALVALASCFALSAAPAAPHNDYADPGKWLCRPGASDACSGALTATVLAADGTRSQRAFHADPNAPIDCFYVYPTVSRQATPNSDRTAGPEELHAAQEQFARFGEACRLYAPLYRQVTLVGLRTALHGDEAGIDYAAPYHDVLDAWHSYLEHDNQGRGVVLIGHSQGARILTHLVASEIDGKLLQKQLISAILLGTNIETPTGQLLGGTFQHIPLCSQQSQIGCVVAYSSYLAVEPPSAGARFGAASHPGSIYACVNPAALNGNGELNADFPAEGEIGRLFGTTFIENPGLLSARCAVSGGYSYLAVSISQGPIGEKVMAELTAVQSHLPGWGLHALDVNLALGNLVDLVAAQSKAWSAAHQSAHR